MHNRHGFVHFLFLMYVFQFCVFNPAFSSYFASSHASVYCIHTYWQQGENLEKEYSHAKYGKVKTFNPAVYNWTILSKNLLQTASTMLRTSSPFAQIVRLMASWNNLHCLQGTVCTAHYCHFHEIVIPGDTRTEGAVSTTRHFHTTGEQYLHEDH